MKTWGAAGEKKHSGKEQKKRPEMWRPTLVRGKPLTTEWKSIRTSKRDEKPWVGERKQG